MGNSLNGSSTAGWFESALSFAVGALEVMSSDNMSMKSSSSDDDTTWYMTPEDTSEQQSQSKRE